jgi:hypothetical protein
LDGDHAAAPQLTVTYSYPYTGSASGELLMQLDPATGAVIPDTFGAGLSCIEITGVSPLGNQNVDDDIEDIAIAHDGVMYGIFRANGQAETLVTIDRATGAATAVGGDLGVTGMKGLGLNPMGGLVGSAGYDAANPARDTLFAIDADAGTASVSAGGYQNLEIAGVPAAQNDEAIDCRPAFAPEVGIDIVDSDDVRLAWPRVTHNSAGAAIDVIKYVVDRDDAPYRGAAATLAATLNGPFITDPVTWPDPDHIGNPATNYFYYVRAAILDEYGHETFSDFTNHIGEFDFALTPGN